MELPLPNSPLPHPVWYTSSALKELELSRKTSSNHENLRIETLCNRRHKAPTAPHLNKNEMTLYHMNIHWTYIYIYTRTYIHTVLWICAHIYIYIYIEIQYMNTVCRCYPKWPVQYLFRCLEIFTGSLGAAETNNQVTPRYPTRCHKSWECPLSCHRSELLVYLSLGSKNHLTTKTCWHYTGRWSIEKKLCSVLFPCNFLGEVSCFPID